MLKRTLLAIILILGIPTMAFADDWHSLPDGICAKYAAQEFEKLSPEPHVNWLNYNYDWVIQAQKAGWVVTTEVHSVVPGAIAEWQNNDRTDGHVAIVRHVLADKIIVEENNVGNTVDSMKFFFGGKTCKATVTDGWGKTTLRAISYDDMIKMGTRKFTGYIWPLRQSEYDQNPAKYQVSLESQMATKEPSYKGFREYWSITYILKEFDQIAPAPGVNWHGKVTDWLVNAQKSGWVTKNTPADAQVGALLLQVNPTTSLVKVGIVRAISNGSIVVDSRSADLYPHTDTLSIETLKSPDKKGFVFLGYICPVRI